MKEGYFKKGGYPIRFNYGTGTDPMSMSLFGIDVKFKDVYTTVTENQIKDYCEEYNCEFIEQKLI